MSATIQTPSRRQMMFFSQLTDVIPHIQFACFVNKRKLTASLTHLEDTGVETLYHVSFSDGHTDAYEARDAEGSRQKQMRDAYEGSIFDDLCVLPMFIKMKERSLTNFRVYGEAGENFNVWLCERQGHYDVYYLRKYRFTLRNLDGWQVRTRRDKGLIVNQQLANLICQHLDSNKILF